MNISLPLNDHQKLTVTYRIEPGCLGPEGDRHINVFCAFAKERIVDLDADFIHWQILPRRNKELAEMEYSVMNKQLNHDKADKYLQLFGKRLDEFESHIEERCVTLIDEYFSR